MKNYNYYTRKGMEDSSFERNYNIALLGNCSTETLSNVLRGYYAEKSIGLKVLETSYDSINFEVFNSNSEIYKEELSYLILYYSPLKLRDNYYKFNNKIEFSRDFISELRLCVSALKEKGITAILTSIPTNLEKCFGNASATFEITLMSQLQIINHGIKEIVRENKNCHLLDIEHIANNIGMNNFHSDKLWSIGKYPCHPKYYPTICNEIYNIDQALSGKSKKVIVLDLDNTLWGGVIGDDGLSGISIGTSVVGESFKAFQYYLKSLKEKGYLLVVCSKNDYNNAIEPFLSHDEMVLKESDIAMFVANWEPKSSNIREISRTLNLGLDSFVFVDDNPFERNEVRLALPEVLVPELPDDPSEYISALNLANFLDIVTYSETDKNRTNLYQIEALRNKELSSSTDIDDYLKSLNMVATVESITAYNIERSSQLMLRSNQFNLRTQRLTMGDLEVLSKNENYDTLAFSLEDKYGKSGLISAVVLRRENEAYFIDEFVMSCRVLKRGVEHFILSEIISLAKSKSIKKIYAEYIPSPKNKLVENLYDELGFKLKSAQPFPYYIDATSFIQKKQIFIKRKNDD